MFFWLIVRSLATWRVSYMLYVEEGPGEVFRKLRTQYGVEHDDEGPFAYPPGSVFACLGCLSVWVGLLLGFVPKGIQLGLAASSGAILFDIYKERLSGTGFNANDALD